jgi:hypothetical protein
MYISLYYIHTHTHTGTSLSLPQEQHFSLSEEQVRRFHEPMRCHEPMRSLLAVSGASVAHPSIPSRIELFLHPKLFLHSSVRRELLFQSSLLKILLYYSAAIIAQCCHDLATTDAKKNLLQRQKSPEAWYSVDTCHVSRVHLPGSRTRV